MNKILIFIILLLFFGFGSNPSNKITNKLPVKNFKEIFGPRFTISGDFNGDEEIDTLRELYLSSINNKETNKYYDVDYDSMVSLAVKKKPICKIVSNNNKIEPLIIKDTITWQLFGLAFLKNEGDLDNNGTDEIGLIIDWADWSNVNSYLVYTYSDNKWKQILSFEIRDFDISELSKKGFLYKNSKGQIVVHTYELGDKIDKVIKLNN